MASVPAGKLPAAVTTRSGQGHNRDCPAWGDDVLTMDLPSSAQGWADCQTTKATSSKHPGTAQARMRSTRRQDVFMVVMVPQPLGRQAWRGRARLVAIPFKDRPCPSVLPPCWASP